MKWAYGATAFTFMDRGGAAPPCTVKYKYSPVCRDESTCCGRLCTLVKPSTTVGTRINSIILSTTEATTRVFSTLVCMYGHHIYRVARVRINPDEPGKVANPARGQLNREN